MPRLKWSYIVRYHCGCTDEFARKRDRLGYCGTHGTDEVECHKVPANQATEAFLERATEGLTPRPREGA